MEGRDNKDGGGVEVHSDLLLGISWVHRGPPGSEVQVHDGSQLTKEAKCYLGQSRYNIMIRNKNGVQWTRRYFVNKLS